jgi:uncharacterized protein
MTSSPESSEVRHEPDRSRFIMDVAGEAATAEYEQRGDDLVLTRTHVPPEAEGEGVASALARSALEYARAEGLRVVPRCRFMASYIDRHPEYQELVDRR